MSAYKPHEFDVETASGRFLNLADPKPESIVISDVAQGLAMTCRYGAQTKSSARDRRFYSVAEHARLVAWRLNHQGASPEVQLAGLHHDDAEAYVGDNVRPLKLLVPGLKYVEERVFAAIVKALGLGDLPLNDRAIKSADDWALSAEAWHLMSTRGESWWCAGLYDRDDEMIAGSSLNWQAAERLWFEHHGVLCQQVGILP